MNDRYVIRNGYLFWRPEGHGYTSQVLEAGLWSKEEAEKIAANRPNKDEAVPLAHYLKRLDITPEVLAALGTEAKDLWYEFLGPDRPYTSLGHEMKNCHCGICGNTGIIDTRGRIQTPAGRECGVRRYCICPNGRSMLSQEDGKQLHG